MKKIAILPASGIGDSLIFQAVARHTEKVGWTPTTFSDSLAEFGCWFPEGRFLPAPPSSLLKPLLSPFDAIFLQHDNSEKAFQIQSLFKQTKTLYTFYGSYQAGKHPPFDPTRDFLCNRSCSMLLNAGMAASQFFGGTFTKENGLCPPPGLFHRKHKRRIVIHPTSSSHAKNWPRHRFLSVAQMLKKEGYEPIFIVSPQERSSWSEASSFQTLEQLSSFFYESGAFLGNDSGLGHLASALFLPHVILGPSFEQLTLWGPGWRSGKHLFPPSWMIQFHWMKKRWKYLIPINKVIKELKKEII